MRLINTETGAFEEFFDLKEAPPYAILSHTWDAKEQTYQEVLKIQQQYSFQEPPPSPHPIWNPDSGLSEKVRRACEIARRDGYRYIWVDSSCIDKTSSSELSEAINSMYNWYRAAHVCYAFLRDVPHDENLWTADSKFRKSKWFTRGWTLQELIAPRVVIFFSGDWKGLGTKEALADVVQEITSIDRGVLMHKRPFSDETVANRMRWASKRKTTRVEDQAYCLLGIFDITMPALYGEGSYAFRRLQEMILRRIPDQSLFAWGMKCPPIPKHGKFDIQVAIKSDLATLLAPSPESFASETRNKTIRTDQAISSALPITEYTDTPFGIRTELRLLPLQVLNPEIEVEHFDFDSGVENPRAPLPWYIVLLGCQDADPESEGPSLLGKLCYIRRNNEFGVDFLHVPDLVMKPGLAPNRATNSLLFTLSSDFFASISRRRREKVQIKTVYLPHPKSSVAARQLEDSEFQPLDLAVPTWVRDTLMMHKYTVSAIQGPSEHHPESSSLTLSHDSAAHYIHIQYRHMHIDRDRLIQARIWILSDQSQVLDVHSAPPYTSATWTDETPWNATLQTQRITLPTTLPTSSGDSSVTLQLGFDLTEASRYNVCIEVLPTGAVEAGVPFHGDVKSLKDYRFRHRTLDFILLGSVRRALETKGYSVHTEVGQDLGGFPGRSHSLTLTPTRTRHEEFGDFVVVAKVFHVVCRPNSSEEHVIVVARVTLESSSAPEDGSDTCLDGPHVVHWYGRSAKRNLGENKIVLVKPDRESLTLTMDLKVAWPSEYDLYVDVIGPTELSQPIEPFRRPQPDTVRRFKPEGVHGTLMLMLPGHIKRALEAQGCHVRSYRPDTGEYPSEDPVHHCLALSHNSDTTIIIEYSHHLTTSHTHPSQEQVTQELTFRARVKVSPTPGVQSSPSKYPKGRGKTRKTVQGDQTTSMVTVDWNAEDTCTENKFWERNVPRKDVMLDLPTGHRLTLRLGFDLVWFSEYLLVVELNPRRPLPPPPPPDSPRPANTYQMIDEDLHMEAIVEQMLQSMRRDGEAGQSVEAHDEPMILLDPATLISLGGAPVLLNFQEPLEVEAQPRRRARGNRASMGFWNSSRTVMGSISRTFRSGRTVLGKALKRTSHD